MGRRPWTAHLTVLFVLGVTAALAADGSSSSNAASSGRALSVSKIDVEVTGSDGTLRKAAGVSYPNALTDDFVLEGQAQLELKYEPQRAGRPFNPQQSMLLLQSAAGPSAYMLAKAKGGTHVVTVSLAALEKQIGKQAGEFKLSLVLGDPKEPVGVVWQFGTLTVEAPPAKAGAASSGVVPPLTAAHQPVGNIKPEIVHQHRSPEKRPPSVVSLAFAGLALAPLVGLLVVLLRNGANLKGFPDQQPASLYAMLFHTGIAAMLGLYLLFWLKLNLADTLPLSLLLGTGVAVTGYKALSAIADARIGGRSTKRE